MTTHQVTRLLQRIREGEQEALDELLRLVGGELRRIAGSLVRRQQPGHTLQPTALVNEAFIKLFQDARPQLVDRAHFLALMARVMRQALRPHRTARPSLRPGMAPPRAGLLVSRRFTRSTSRGTLLKDGDLAYSRDDAPSAAK
jgi:DNA-directed RNA polymerase specialized sigma24 family protein